MGKRKAHEQEFLMVQYENELWRLQEVYEEFGSSSDEYEIQLIAVDCAFRQALDRGIKPDDLAFIKLKVAEEINNG